MVSISHTKWYVKLFMGKLVKKTSRAHSQAQTREQLMQAAESLFSQYGLNGTSIDKIVALAGFTKGAFYSNFASKEDLMLALLDKHKEQVFAQMQDLINATKKEDLIGEIQKWLKDSVADKNWVLFSAELEMSAARNPDFNKIYKQFMDIQYEKLAASLDDIFEKLGAKTPMLSIELARILKRQIHASALNALACGDDTNQTDDIMALFAALIK